jgi:hypothetical protein
MLEHSAGLARSRGRCEGHFVELTEETLQGAVHCRTRTSMDFDVELPRGCVRADVGFGDEEILQEPPRSGSVNDRRAQQTAKGGFRPIGNHAHGVHEPLTP